MSLEIHPDLWYQQALDETGLDDTEQSNAQSLMQFLEPYMELTPFPDSTQRLISALQQSDYDVQAIERIVSQDPALAARVLSVVNSASYALPSRCTSIARAVTVLGARPLREIVTAVSVFQLFDHGSELISTIRQHCACVGGIAQWLSRTIGPRGENAFISGLFHDLGKLLLLQSTPGMYDEMLRNSNFRADAIHQEERNEFGFDHGLLGGHILRAWGIPEPVPKVVAWHHQPERQHHEAPHDEEVDSLLRLITLADHLAAALAKENEVDEEVASTILEAIPCRDDDSPLLVAPDLLRLWPELCFVYRESIQALGK